MTILSHSQFAGYDALGSELNNRFDKNQIEIIFILFRSFNENPLTVCAVNTQWPHLFIFVFVLLLHTDRYTSLGN